MDHRLYFDAVPFEVIANIVRHTSSSPYSKLWLQKVSCIDALCLLEIGGALKQSAQEAFKAITFSYCDNFESDTNLMVITKPVLYDKILAHLAPHLQYFLFPFSRQWIGSVRFCRLRALEIGYATQVPAVDLILGSCGDSLSDLKVTKLNLEPDLVHSIRKNCNNLRKLDISFANCAVSLKDMWIKLSRTLSEVSCSTRGQEYIEIAKHCRKLKKIQVSDFQKTWANNLEDFFSSLSYCVVILCFSFDEYSEPISFGRLGNVIESFRSNVIVYTHITSTSVAHCESFFQSSGTTLRALNLFCSGETLSSNSFESLRNLRSIEITSLNGIKNDELVGTILRRPLNELRKLKICGFIDLRKLLVVLANQSFSLDRLDCTNAVLDNKEKLSAKIAMDFKKFFDTNKSLRWFDVKVRNKGCFSTEYVGGSLLIADILQNLRFCSLLEEFFIHFYHVSFDYHVLKSACVPLRNRQVNIVVNGFGL